MRKIVLAIILMGAAGVASAESIQNTAQGPDRATTCTLAISRAKLLATNLNNNAHLDFGSPRCECDKMPNGYYSCMASMDVYKR